MCDKKAFTLIEILLVIGIVIVMMSASAPFLSRFLNLNNVDTMSDKTVGVIRKAQSYAMNRKANATWGVCVTGGNLRLYAGSCAAPTISEDYAIPGAITYSGLSDATFSLRGEPSTTSTVTISGAGITRTIILNAAGGVQIN